MLEISDMIKSKQVSSGSVLSELENKMNSENMIFACTLLDCLIKNSGPLFIEETNNHRQLFSNVAEYIQGNQSTEVKQHFLEWAHLLKSYNSFIFDLFVRLKYNNIEFGKYTANEVILECSLAPEWMDSDSCQICSNNFNLINRKHHCRSCGKCVCNNCSKERMQLPQFGILQDVRVCNQCKSSSSTGYNTTALDISDKREQDELELAIKESLKMTQQAQPKKPADDLDAQEEAMIKQAIELSLKDSKLLQQSSNIKKNIYKAYEPNLQLKTTPMEPQQYSNYSPQVEQAQQVQQSPYSATHLELTQSEIATLDLFYAW